MKVFNVIFLVVFILSAGLQYNDPDPYIWMPLYFFGAFLCYEAIRKRYKPTLYIMGLVVYISYAIFLFFDKDGVISWANKHHSESIVQSMKATKPWIEETREFGGLLLLILALVCNMIWLNKKRLQKKAHV